MKKFVGSIIKELRGSKIFQIWPFCIKYTPPKIKFYELCYLTKFLIQPSGALEIDPFKKASDQNFE